MKTISVASAWRLSTFAAALLLVVIVSTAAMAQDVVAPGTSLGIASVPNLRDTGGYTTADGWVVRRGVAYRSNQLNPISAQDMNEDCSSGIEERFRLEDGGGARGET